MSDQPTNEVADEVKPKKAAPKLPPSQRDKARAITLAKMAAKTK
jgi:hypothetical protein